ncbi:Gfo/Idh/MocA family oxidoreductase [Fodinicurvata sp. EGI_FJ10296]|uniref:Gfo/Idh/MocA family protein n=1 Tax=Fodinicurvata sp. EGI_FJ10296 TaxID=3231908 RepID=UPI003455A041
MTRHFLIAGLGSIGRRHMTNLAAAHPGASFTVLRHQHATNPLCCQLGARIVTDRDAAIAGEYDLAVVSSASANHIDVLPGLIARGTPLLVEKPIVTTPADCDLVLDCLATAPQAVRVSGFNFRYLPSLKLIRELIQNGELGTVVRASFTAGQWLGDWRKGTDYRQSYSADAARGGGVELDLVHEIDLARWFFGDLDLQFAQSGRLSSLGLNSNDVSVMVMSPLAATGPIVQVALDYVAPQRLRHYEFVGDRAAILWDISGRVELITAKSRQLLVENPDGFDVAQTYIDMLAHIEETVHTGGWPAPLQDLADGVASTRLALAARDIGTNQGKRQTE